MDATFVTPPEVRLLNEDTAAVGYEVRHQVRAGGKDSTFEAVDTSTWVRRDGRWVCALHTETPRGTR